MIERCFCRPREQLCCFYITEDNVSDFVKNYGYNGKCTITSDKNFAYVRYEKMVWHIKLNAFMVYENEGWTSYTQKEFDETYELMK
jgi:hypothetical protein